MLSPLLINLERCLVGMLAVVALLLAIVSFRGLVPVPDPLTPVTYVDRLSLLFGLHEQSHIAVVSALPWTTELHLFTFQKRLKDGAFYLTTEAKSSLGWGLLEHSPSPSMQLPPQEKCSSLLSALRSLLPFPASPRQVPLLLGIPGTEKRLEVPGARNILQSLHSCLTDSDFDYRAEGSLGLVPPSLESSMQWFALALLQGRLPYLKPWETPVVAETTEEDLHLTFATQDLSRLGNLSSALHMHQQVEVFGETWDLVTLTLPGLGVMRARQAVLTLSNNSNKGVLTSPCVNPVVDRWWEWKGQTYHVKGLPRSVEEVKERNGPFAGKKVSRPVANYEVCHGVVAEHVKGVLEQQDSFQSLVKEVSKRKVYIGGKLFIKCAERGLTDPFKGGNVKLKTFMDSLKHACKVPNTDQPYACVDMMVVGVVLDKVLGLHQGSALHTPHSVNGMTGGWPVTAAIHTYQQGV